MHCHAMPLFVVQAQEALSQALQEAQEPTPALPQKPPAKLKLKTFSMAVR